MAVIKYMQDRHRTRSEMYTVDGVYVAPQTQRAGEYDAPPVVARDTAAAIPALLEMHNRGGREASPGGIEGNPTTAPIIAICHS
jgi:hypothetical protein